MVERLRSGFSNDVTWDIEPMPVPRDSHRRRDLHGTLVLDIDGTLTKPGSKYTIDGRGVDACARFLMGGGNLVFNSGATRYRIERTLLDPLYKCVEDLDPKADVKGLFKNVFLQPENGSALLLNKRIYVQENMLEFGWYRIHQMHVPQKRELRAFLEDEFVNNPGFRGCEVADDTHPSESLRREYIVSLKGLKEGTTRDVINVINGLKDKHGEIDWDLIRMKAARTTVDFVHRDSGKTISTEFLLKELSGLDGPVMGFGDLGDEFASVVPTVNVNQEKPNEFRIRGQPSMELKSGYTLLKKDSYLSVGEGKDERIMDKESGQEVTVLRDGSGRVVYGRPVSKDDPYFGRVEVIQPSDSGEGAPMQIMDLKYSVDAWTGEAVRNRQDFMGEAGRIREVIVEDAGMGTAWMIDYLMGVGYFSKPNLKNNG
jgi:hypothetical protein